MKKLQFTRTVFESGFPKFAAGQLVDPTPELEKHVRRGDAKLIEVADEPKQDEAATPKKKAKKAAEPTETEKAPE